MATANSLSFKKPLGATDKHSKRNPSYGSNGQINPSIDPKNRGPAGMDPATKIHYQFLNSYSAVGDSGGVSPANRLYIQATNLDMKRRLQASQNILGLTKKQITMNEKTGSGQSNVVTTQMNYTTDYHQLPSTINSFIPEFSKENLPYYVAGALILYIFFFRE